MYAPLSCTRYRLFLKLWGLRGRSGEGPPPHLGRESDMGTFSEEALCVFDVRLAQVLWGPSTLEPLVCDLFVSLGWKSWPCCPKKVAYPEHTRLVDIEIVYRHQLLFRPTPTSGQRYIGAP